MLATKRPILSWVELRLSIELVRKVTCHWVQIHSGRPGWRAQLSAKALWYLSDLLLDLLQVRL